MDVGAVEAPLFGGANHASDHDHRPRYREVGFQVQGVDAEGNVVLRRQLKRRYVLAFFQKLPPCLVGIQGTRRARGITRSRSVRPPNRNAEPVDPAIRTTHSGQSIVKCEVVTGT